MKLFFDRWREFLNEGNLDKHGVKGKIRLYHYSKIPEENLMLDPEYFLTHRHSYSRKDFNMSDMPRIFFYTNLDHAEAVVKQGSSLFTTFVPTNEIYDLASDPLELKQKSAPYPEIPVPDYDRILRSLANQPRTPKYGTASPSLLGPEQSTYRGAFYATGDMDVVVWFEPIEVEKFNPDDVRVPEKTEI
jgi:hypothetical protein